ncbi:hypothetical protein M3Y98_01187300 [Aphelenchoides besseyi]|nr:hypothetical protein M3Y98_01187300 [Aphelenchoides besseyi]
MDRLYNSTGPRYAGPPRTYAHLPVDRVTRFPRNTDKSRGLRHFSNRVCEKVKEKGQTNYNEVADELVAEYFDSLTYPPQSHEKQQYDSKNIRRRVYDALNVLMAMNIIEKEKKRNSLGWIAHFSVGVWRKNVNNDKNEFAKKSDQLREYIIQLVAYKSLVHRNRENERTNGRPSEQSILYLPFIILNTERETNVDCAISHDKTEYAMSFDRPFEIHDDIEVLKRMGMAHGLDTGRVEDVDVDRVKKCLPPALRIYIDQIVDGEQEEQGTSVDNMSLGLLPEETQQPPERESPPPPEQKPTSYIATRATPTVSNLVATSTNSNRMTPPVSTSGITNRYIRNIGVQRTLGSGASLHGPVGYARPMFARGGLASRTYIQRAPAPSRYVTPSQSAVYQNAQRSHARQQLYLVQSNGGAPQPIQSNRYQAYPPPRSSQIYQQRSIPYQISNTPQTSRQQAAQQPTEYVEGQYEYIEVDGAEGDSITWLN